MIKKRLFVLFFFLICCSFPALLRAQTVPCCEDPACQATAKQLVSAAGEASKFLGPYPSGHPVDFQGKKRFLDSLKSEKLSQYTTLRDAIKKISDWTGKEPSRTVCISRSYEDLSEDQLYWITYFRTAFYTSRFRSPEFRKGVGLLLHAGTGASAIFKNSERFASLSGLLLSYTFTPKGQEAGGRFRILLGPGLYYSAAKTYWLVHPRIEYRLSDIGNEMTSIGCIKLLAQSGHRHDLHLAGAGIAVELSRFHIQLTENYLFKQSIFALQAGLGYSIHF